MPDTVRFGVSLSIDLLDRFDALIRKRGYENRSEAIRDLLREKLVEQEWEDPEHDAFGVVFLVYDHHALRLDQRLVEVQHDHYDRIVSALHIHIDEHNCLEVVVVRGKVQEVQEIGNRLASMKGVKFGRLNMGTTGEGLT